MLPLYDRKSDRHTERFYTFGDIEPLLTDAAQIPPFQYDFDTAGSVSVFLVAADGGEQNITTAINEAGLRQEQRIGYVSIIYPSTLSIDGIPATGVYYLRLSVDGTNYFTDDFQMCGEGLTRFEFCHFENYELPKGRFIDYSLNFVNKFLTCKQFGKPKYETIRNVSQRNGKDFPVRQIRYKVHQMTLHVTEEQADILSLIPLHDVLKIKTDGRTHDVDEMFVNFTWEDRGDIAVCDIEVRTDTVVIVNGRGVGDKQNLCFVVDFKAVAEVELNGVEYNNGAYMDDGRSVIIKEGEYVVTENAETFDLAERTETGYTNVTLSEGEIVVNRQDNRYYIFDGGELRVNELINYSESGQLSGFALPGVLISLYAVNAEGAETYLQRINAAQLAAGHPVAAPANTVAIRGVFQNAACGVLEEDTTAAVTVQYCAYEIQGFYDNDSDALANNIRTLEYYGTSETNTYGLPEGIVRQYNPGDIYPNDDAALVDLQFADRCYTLAISNDYGLPGGTVKMIVDEITTYRNDLDANINGGLETGDIYPLAINNTYGLPVGTLKIVTAVTG